MTNACGTDNVLVITDRLENQVLATSGQRFVILVSDRIPTEWAVVTRAEIQGRLFSLCAHVCNNNVQYIPHRPSRTYILQIYNLHTVSIPFLPIGNFFFNIVAIMN